jgi:hypothetical protein
MQSESDSRPVLHVPGHRVEGSLPLVVIVRSVATAWALGFVVFFVLCLRHEEEEVALRLQRGLTESWLSLLYTGHLAVDAFLCLSGVLLGRKIFTAVIVSVCSSVDVRERLSAGGGGVAFCDAQPNQCKRAASPPPLPPFPVAARWYCHQQH